VVGDAWDKAEAAAGREVGEEDGADAEEIVIPRSLFLDLSFYACLMSEILSVGKNPNTCE